MVGYYDLVLALIPAALIGGFVALRLGGVGDRLALIVGGLLAVAITAHALFVRAPVDGATTPHPYDRPKA